MNNAARDNDAQEFQPKTELARTLWEIRQRAIRDGMRLLAAEEIERLVEESRGGRAGMDDDPSDLSV